jgi:hypothetical protein
MNDIALIKLALEALEKADRHCPVNTEAEVFVRLSITALKDRLADPMREVQRLGQEIEQEPVAQPERHELQAKGEHPAPCARHCEANAFQIVIKNLKAQLAQPEQEPLAWAEFDGEGGHRFITYEFNETYEEDWNKRHPNHIGWVIPLYTHPPQRTWVGLTKEQISEFDTWHDNREEEVGWVNPSEIVAYIDAKLKHKNGYAEEKNT